MDVALPFLGVTNAWITPPVVISVAALIFTLASFWWIQVRRGRLRVETGPVFSGAITSNKIVLNVPLVFHNPAPASLVVTDIKLHLNGGAGDANSPDHKALPKRMFWIAFHGSVYPESDKHRQFAMPFAVEGRKSVEHRTGPSPAPPLRLDHQSLVFRWKLRAGLVNGCATRDQKVDLASRWVGVPVTNVSVRHEVSFPS